MSGWEFQVTERILGLELRTLTLSHSLHQPFFVKGIFKIGSLEQFA
jgi:hypothetical protein